MVFILSRSVVIILLHTFQTVPHDATYDRCHCLQSYHSYHHFFGTDLHDATYNRCHCLQSSLSILILTTLYTLFFLLCSLPACSSPIPHTFHSNNALPYSVPSLNRMCKQLFFSLAGSHLHVTNVYFNNCMYFLFYIVYVFCSM